MKKDNFIKKSTKAKENVRCIVKIEKKNEKKIEKNVKLYKVRIEQYVNTKKSRKIIFYFIFTRVFNFFVRRLKFTHAFSQSYLPFPK